MARKILSGLTLALLLALTPSTARAQEDFGGGGGVDYSSYDSGGGYGSYDTQSYGYDDASAYDTSGSGSTSSGQDTTYGYDDASTYGSTGSDTSSSGYDTETYGYDNASTYGGTGSDTSSSGYDTETYGYDNASAYDTSSMMTGGDGNDAVLSSSSGVDTADVAAGDPSSWDAVPATNDSTDGWGTSPASTSDANSWDAVPTTNDSTDGWNSTTTPAADAGENGIASPTGDTDGWSSNDQNDDALAAPSMRDRPTPLPTPPADYVPSEQAERVVQLAGGDANQQRTLQHQFDNLPQGIRDEVDGSGARIVTCTDNVTDARSSLAGQTTADGRRMEEVGGIFMERGTPGASYPTAAVCLVDQNGQLSYPGTSSSRDVNGHEVVHIVDRAQGRPSQGPEFQTALNLDRELARGGDQGSRELLGSYYNGRLGPMDRGAQEAYAEGGARYLIGDRSWPNTFQYFQSQPIFQRR